MDNPKMYVIVDGNDEPAVFVPSVIDERRGTLEVFTDADEAERARFAMWDDLRGTFKVRVLRTADAMLKARTSGGASND